MSRSSMRAKERTELQSSRCTQVMLVVGTSLTSCFQVATKAQTEEASLSDNGDGDDDAQGDGLEQTEPYLESFDCKPGSSTSSR